MRAYDHRRRPARRMVPIARGKTGLWPEHNHFGRTAVAHTFGVSVKRVHAGFLRGQRFFDRGTGNVWRAVEAGGETGRMGRVWTLPESGERQDLAIVHCKPSLFESVGWMSKALGLTAFWGRGNPERSPGSLHSTLRSWNPPGSVDGRDRSHGEDPGGVQIPNAQTIRAMAGDPERRKG